MQTQLFIQYFFIALDSLLSRPGIPYVLGAATAAISAIVAAVLTNFINWFNQNLKADWDADQNRIQREYDAIEAAKDRLHDLQKNFYFPFLQSLPAAAYSLLPYKNLTKLPETAAPVTAFNSAASALSLVTSDAMDSAIHAFDSKLEEYHLELQNHRAQALRTKQHYDFIDADFKKQQDLVSLLEKNFSDTQCGNLDSAPNRSSETLHAARETLKAKQINAAEHWNNFTTAAESIESLCDSRIALLLNLADECRIAARRELSIEGDSFASRRNSLLKHRTTLGTRRKYRQEFFKTVRVPTSPQTAHKPAPTPPAPPSAPQSGSDDTPSSETAPPEDSAEGSSGSQSR